MEKNNIIVIVAVLLCVIWVVLMRRLLQKLINIPVDMALDSTNLQVQYKKQKSQSLEWKKRARRLRRKARILYFFTKREPYLEYAFYQDIYNKASYMMAATELLEGNDDEFIKLANEPPILTPYELMPCLLALYYYGQENKEMAEQCYKSYLQCDHKDQYIEQIMKAIFSDSERDRKVLKRTVKRVTDQAILKELRDIGVIKA